MYDIFKELALVVLRDFCHLAGPSRPIPIALSPLHWKLLA